MKKLVLAAVMLVAMCTSALAFDMNGYTELQSYEKGYNWSDTYLEVGQDLGLLRSFAAVQYWADSNNPNIGLTMFYKLGVSKQIGIVNVAGGAMYADNLQPNTTDMVGGFIRVSFSYDSAK